MEAQAELWEGYHTTYIDEDSIAHGTNEHYTQAFGEPGNDDQISCYVTTSPEAEPETMRMMVTIRAIDIVRMMKNPIGAVNELNEVVEKNLPDHT
ncbi:hypothetical protein H2203_001748 [Taxawa tesnikishii (nom. ined.)]|nr:hypothetical protein H2203_001748 [Dothideales sp. JES 119]